MNRVWELRPDLKVKEEADLLKRAKLLDMRLDPRHGRARPMVQTHPRRARALAGDGIVPLPGSERDDPFA